LQEKAEAAYQTFMAKLRSAIEASASQDLGDDIEGEQRDAVKKSVANKKMAAVKTAVRVVASTASASIEWAADYVRTELEESCWQETSDIHTQPAARTDEQR
jgi:hypothetical protein